MTLQWRVDLRCSERDKHDLASKKVCDDGRNICGQRATLSARDEVAFLLFGLVPNVPVRMERVALSGYTILARHSTRQGGASKPRSLILLTLALSRSAGQKGVTRGPPKVFFCKQKPSLTLLF